MGHIVSANTDNYVMLEHGGAISKELYMADFVSQSHHFQSEGASTFGMSCHHDIVTHYCNNVYTVRIHILKT